MTPNPKTGPLNSKAGQRGTEGSRRRKLRSSSASSFTTHAREGDVNDDCVSICSSEGEWSEDKFKTPPAGTPRCDLTKPETRGRHPKDSIARAAKKETIKLRRQVRNLRAEKERLEEKSRLEEEFGDLVREGRVWESA